jgi:hypothetical protein
VSLKGFRPLLSKNGNQYIKKPNKNMIKVRFITFEKKILLDRVSYKGMLKLMELPTIKRNVGKTKSVSVKPCHLACNNGAKVVASFPGEFTIIMRAISKPLKTSNDKYRFLS